MTWWSAWSPWLKFIRATFIPASRRAAMPSSEEVAGPMVQTIFARRVIAGLSVGLTCRDFRASRKLLCPGGRPVGSARCGGGVFAPGVARRGCTQGFGVAQRFDTEQGGSFVLGQPSPDPVGLPGPQGVVKAVVNGGTAAANGLGHGDASLAGGVPLVGRMEERGGIHALAGRPDLPFPVH